MRIIGIDPGITGGIALLVNSRLEAISDMPCLDGEANGRLLALLFGQLEPDVVVIEHVQPMPKNGSIASFSLGKNYGIVVGVASSLQHPLVKIKPMDWKKANGLIKKPKAASRQLAAELWPHMASRFALVKNDGLAEAALIARAHVARSVWIENEINNASDALTAQLWLDTINRVDKHDRTTEILCDVLEEIIIKIDDPELGRILDIHAGRILQ